MAVEVLLGI